MHFLRQSYTRSQEEYSTGSKRGLGTSRAQHGSEPAHLSRSAFPYLTDFQGEILKPLHELVLLDVHQHASEPLAGGRQESLGVWDVRVCEIRVNDTAVVGHAVLEGDDEWLLG